MKRWPKVALGDLLERALEPAVIDSKATYHEVTIKLWGKGVVSRGIVSGSDVISNRQFVRADQLILSKIDARNGAIGLVPPELDGAIVSNDFPSFRVADESKCDVRFIGWLARSAPFVDLCKAASEGTTNRVRIKEERFLNQAVRLPSLYEQRAIVARLEGLEARTRQIAEHLDAAEREGARLLAQRFQTIAVSAPLISMGEVAPLLRREIIPQFDQQYTELGVRSFFRGTFHRRTVRGSEFTWQNLFRVSEGDIVFSNIMAWEQAIAVASADDDGCVGNHRMMTCEANAHLCRPDYLWYYFTTDDGFAKVFAASPGTAARNRTMTSSALMAIDVPVPPLADQDAFCSLQKHLKRLKENHTAIRAANDRLIPVTLHRLFVERD